MPIYVSGPQAVGWWAMFITMLGDMTAFIALVFGYFFYWTIHEDFPPDPLPGPGVLWPVVSLLLFVASWWLTILSRRWNRTDHAKAYYGVLTTAALLTIAGGVALVAGPWTTELDPTSHVYPAIVWILVIWTAGHAAVGFIMQAYCIARRAAGKMTSRYDADICNVTLYWHFLALTAVITVATIAGFPLLT